MQKPIAIVTEDQVIRTHTLNDASAKAAQKLVVAQWTAEEGSKYPVWFIDMHNVLDVYDPAEITPFMEHNGLRICVSWVGSLDNYIGKQLVPDMQERIKSGQIHFGIICCARGNRLKKKDRNQDPDACTNGRKICTKFGSKAQVISTIMSWLSTNAHGFFFDDAEDHVASVDQMDRQSGIRVDAFHVPHGTDKEVKHTIADIVARTPK